MGCSLTSEEKYISNNTVGICFIVDLISLSRKELSWGIDDNGMDETEKL